MQAYEVGTAADTFGGRAFNVHPTTSTETDLPVFVVHGLESVPERLLTPHGHVVRFRRTPDDMTDFEETLTKHIEASTGDLVHIVNTQLNTTLPAEHKLVCINPAPTFSAPLPCLMMVDPTEQPDVMTEASLLMQAQPEGADIFIGEHHHTLGAPWLSRIVDWAQRT